jgi:V8-like Glu-specific endopeptidase
METFINEDALKVVIDDTKKLIKLGKLKEAFIFLDKYLSPISDDLADSILINTSRFNSLEQKITNGLITSENADVQQNQLKVSLLSIMDRVPDEIEVKRIMGEIKPTIYTTTSESNLEKILGPTSNLLKVNWLQKAINASKSVCQVVRNDGQKGTGFIVKGGYLMTNFHVLPNADRASKAKIVFDFEEDLLGNSRKTSEFFLDATDAKFSKVSEFDYAYIKIKDNPANPLSQWGHLEVDTFSEPQIDQPVTIIQHPLGQTKQIALTANQVLGINGNKLLYRTDTEPGSSGSPVFNNDWKVIALHHAGVGEEDGGLVINPTTGEKRGANEGILISKIVNQIGSDKF